MARLRSDFKNGTITDNPLTNVATTINSAAFANLPTVTAPDELTLVLDPTASAGAPEIVRVTAHTASATSVTVARGQEGTAARQHASGMTWRHTGTSSDFVTVCTSATRPTSGLYEGRLIYETDTDRLMIYDGTTWVQHGVELGAWTSYTPTLIQGATNNIAKTVTWARYQKVGRIVSVSMLLAVTGAGTASNSIQVTLPPFNSAGPAGMVLAGSAKVVDASAGLAYKGFPEIVSATGVAFIPSDLTVNNYIGATGMTAALASGDFVTCSFSYESTS